MGFCTPKQHDKFLEQCPVAEKYMVDSGIILIKYWMEWAKKNRSAGLKPASKTHCASGS